MASLTANRGLVTNQNELTRPDGALEVADNCIIDADNVVEPRRGFSDFGSATSTNNNSENYVVLYRDNTPITDTKRLAQSVSSSFRFQLNTLGVIDFDGTQQLRVYVKVSTGTLTINARTGVAFRLGGVG